jgi:hypothetical protein
MAKLSHVLNSSGHSVKCKNMMFLKKLNICAIVKFCQQIDDTPLDTLEKIKLTGKLIYHQGNSFQLV